MDNPFDRYGLDPRSGIEAITQRLKELAEEAATDAEREELRHAWETLTLHPRERLRSALFAYPGGDDSSPGMPPPRRRNVGHGPMTASDLLPRALVSPLVGGVTSGAGDVVPSLDTDPILDV